jgi:hypothetical protein
MLKGNDLEELERNLEDTQIGLSGGVFHLHDVEEAEFSSLIL